jgi:hypothetical protein
MATRASPAALRRYFLEASGRRRLEGMKAMRRELLDHVLVLDEGHLGSLLHQYQLYFSESRPHQGIG